MTKEKKPKKNVRAGKNQSKAADDVKTTDEDREILEMTERTLIVPPREEETISLDDKDDDTNTDKVTETGDHAPDMTNKTDTDDDVQKMSTPEPDKNLPDREKTDSDAQQRQKNAAALEEAIEWEEEEEEEEEEVTAAEEEQEEEEEEEEEKEK